jgi:hypothetical protein
MSIRSPLGELDNRRQLLGLDFSQQHTITNRLSPGACPRAHIRPRPVACDIACHQGEMTSREIFDIVQTIILLVGFGGLAYWLRRWIIALKGAVDAQRATIDAQKVFIESMAAPKMLERYEAYRKLVDHEKDAALAQYEKQLQELRSSPSSADNQIFDVVAEVMAFVPAEKRIRIIESATLPVSHSERLARIAVTAPDLVAQANKAATESLKKLEEELIKRQTQLAQEALARIVRQRDEALRRK